MKYIKHVDPFTNETSQIAISDKSALEMEIFGKDEFIRDVPWKQIPMVVLKPAFDDEI